MALMEANDEKYNTIFASQEKAVNAALNSAETAVRKAEMASEKRFDAVNEFRATLADQQRTLMPRSEMDVTIRSIATRLENVETRIVERSSKETGIGAGYAIAVGIVGFVAVIGSIGMAIMSFMRGH